MTMTDIPIELQPRVVALLNDVATIEDEGSMPMSLRWALTIEKARAIIALLPEPVDPDLIEAREICALELEAISSGHSAAIFRSGENDGGAMMKAVLSALKRGRELERGEP